MRAQIAESLSGTRPRYPEVGCPTLIVMGAKDKDVPDPVADAKVVEQRRARPATTVIIPGAGHYPQAEMPERTTPAVLGFLAGA